MTVKHATITAVKVDAAQPLQRYATGYGPKQPTRYSVRIVGDSPTARWRRVYVMQYGNSGSVYVVVKGEVQFVNEIDLEIARDVALS